MISKQRKWQLKKQAEGLCECCGKPLVTYCHLCDSCHAKKIKGRPGCRWKKGGKGRPPFKERLK